MAGSFGVPRMSFLLAAGPIIGAASNCKKLVDGVRAAAHAPEEAQYLWRLLEALLGPVAVAQQLAARHAALPIVWPAVALAQLTISQCEPLLPDEDSDESIEEDASADEWRKWLGQKSAGLTRLQLITRLQEKVVHCTAALQLAIASVATRYPPGLATSPYRYLPAAVDAAAGHLQRMEMGREAAVLLCGGELFKFTRGSMSKKGRADVFLARLEQVQVHLVYGSEGGGGSAAKPSRPETHLRLELTPLRPEQGSDEEDEEDELAPAAPSKRVVMLGAAVRFSRCWSTELVELPAEGTGVAAEASAVYRLGESYVLRFLSSGLSSEEFEACVALAKRTDGGARALADVFDGSAASHAALRRSTATDLPLGASPPDPADGVDDVGTTPQSAQPGSGGMGALTTPLAKLRLGKDAPSPGS